jgi:hypothetical protein
MSDPAERFYSPPPPEGLRERLQHHRPSLVGAAVLLLLVGAAFAIARVASGDGKNSGHPERAFGGYLSQSDQDGVSKVTIARREASSAYIEVVAASKKGSLGAVKRAAAAGRNSTELGLQDAARIQNGELRTLLERILSTENKVFVGYWNLATYLKAHPDHASKAKVRELVSAARTAEVDAQSASDAFRERIAPYLTPEQRSELQAQR